VILLSEPDGLLVTQLSTRNHTSAQLNQVILLF